MTQAVTLNVVRNTACDGTPGRETYRVFAVPANSQEVVRAVDASLVAGANSVILRVARQGGNLAPIAPTLPADTCLSYLSWNRITSGVDETWSTPDLQWSDSTISKGWFLSNPTSNQRGSAGAPVQIAQITVQQASTGVCSSAPFVSGTLN